MWLTKSWWKYLLAKPFTFRAFLCRMRGHKGVVWYSGRMDPDMHCSNCGDDLS